MDANAPIRVIPVSCAPKKAPCPTCGKLGQRKRTGNRDVRTIAYKQIAILRITYGEYQARCDCCTTFRSHPEGVLPKAKYDNKVRQAVLDSILDDQLNVEAVRRRMQRDFRLDLSTGFVYDCLHDAVRDLDMAEHRQHVLEKFRGVLCVDELHLGNHTLLLATDPVGDFPVAFALVSANDKDHMGRFLGHLQRHGLQPDVVVTDGSPLYPDLIAKLWPGAEHQLCVFHVMQDLNKRILDAVRRLRARLRRQGRKGRRRKRGRPSKAETRRRQKAGRLLKEKAQFVFKHRYLIVKRRENLSEQDKTNLITMLEYVPALRTLRTFTDKWHRLFDTNQTDYQSWCRRRALVANAEFQAIPELATALAMLEPLKFYKMIAYLRGPAARGTRCERTITWSVATASCDTGKRCVTNGVAAKRWCGFWCWPWTAGGRESYPVRTRPPSRPDIKPRSHRQEHQRKPNHPEGIQIREYEVAMSEKCPFLEVDLRCNSFHTQVG